MRKLITITTALCLASASTAAQAQYSTGITSTAQMERVYQAALEICPATIPEDNPGRAARLQAEARGFTGMEVLLLLNFCMMFVKGSRYQ